MLIRLSLCHAWLDNVCLFLYEKKSVDENYHFSVWTWFLLNLKPSNMKIKISIIRAAHVYTFLALWRHFIMTGTKCYFLKLGNVVAMTSAWHTHMWTNTNFKLKSDNFYLPSDKKTSTHCGWKIDVKSLLLQKINIDEWHAIDAQEENFCITPLLMKNQQTCSDKSLFYFLFFLKVIS